MNGTIDNCDTGSFELVFRDEELEEFARAHPEGLLVKWGHFEGYFTDFQFKEKEKRLFGSHINALIHKAVFPPQSITTQTVEAAVQSLINTYAPWLVFDAAGYTDKIEFATETYMHGDKFLKEYLGKLKWGYRIYMDGSKLHFKLIKPALNPLMFSIGNRNIYEISEDFSCKNAAFGGWYRKTEEDDGTKLEEEQWLYITTEEKEGIYKSDTVLSAHSPQAALDELMAKKIEHTHLAKTRNVEYNTDYTLGQIIRLKSKETTKKQVQSIDFWLEGDTYHEEPVFAEWEE
ncbi:MAG: hypothetical protein IJ454_01150 [Clostridia bacterium]|nr:hypothetical protein [Clostridia bacterium]